VSDECPEAAGCEGYHCCVAKQLSFAEEVGGAFADGEADASKFLVTEAGDWHTGKYASLAGSKAATTVSAAGKEASEWHAGKYATMAGSAASLAGSTAWGQIGLGSEAVGSETAAMSTSVEDKTASATSSVADKTASATSSVADKTASVTSSLGSSVAEQLRKEASAEYHVQQTKLVHDKLADQMRKEASAEYHIHEAQRVQAALSDVRNASLLRLESITDMQEEVAEDVPICTLYDMAGKCWHGNALATGRVPWEVATPHTSMLQLAPTCQSDWFSQWVALQVSTLATEEIQKMKGKSTKEITEEPLLSGAGLVGTEVVVNAMGGLQLTARNVTLLDIQTVAVQYGVCWDYYEWWLKQNFFEQLWSSRNPDTLQVSVSNIAVRLRTNWTLSQSTLGLVSVPVDHGSAELTVRGILMLDVDLHSLTSEPISGCKAKFELTDLDLTPSMMPKAAIMATLQPFLPVIAAALPGIVCYGGADPKGGLSVVGGLTPSLSFSDGGSASIEFKGLQGTGNEVLAQYADVLWFFENDAERYLPSPPPPAPSPPPPPSPSPPLDCWSSCDGAGPCPGFCGEGGLCCSSTLRVSDECPEAAGCEGYHCCVAKQLSFAEEVGGAAANTVSAAGKEASEWHAGKYVSMAGSAAESEVLATAAVADKEAKSWHPGKYASMAGSAIKASVEGLGVGSAEDDGAELTADSLAAESAARSSTPALSLGAALGAAGLLLAAVAALRRSRVQSAAAPGRTEDIAASML